MYDGTNNSSRVGTDVVGSAQIWWLRSPGVNYARYGSYVITDGTVSGSYVGVNALALRPALWLDTTP
jgi:hypothetical protein